MSYTTVQNKLSECNHFIDSKKYKERKGDGFVGNGFEEFLGISENNNRYSDLENLELKTKDINKSCLVTLFTSGKQDGNFKVPKGYFLKTYGKGNIDFMANLSNLRIIVLEDDTVQLVDTLKNKVLYEIFRSELEPLFINKLKNLLIAYYIKKGDMNIITCTRYFKNFSSDKFFNLIRTGKITISLRDSGDHDHGTAFRISDGRIHEVYESNETKMWVKK